MNGLLQSRGSLPQPVRLGIAVLLFGLLPKLVLQVAQSVGWVGPGEPSLAANMACMGIAALVFVAFAVVWPPAVPWRPLRAGRALAAYAPFALAWVSFVVLYLRAMHALGCTVLPQPMLKELAETGGHGSGFWLTLAGAVVLGPVAEEIAFRGYLLGFLSLFLPRWPAQLVTAALFGCVHGWPYALPIGVLGLFFGWLRLRQGSLLPGMLAHAVHNALVCGVTVAWPGSLDLLFPR